MVKRRLKPDPRVLEALHQRALGVGENAERTVERLQERFGLEKVEDLARNCLSRNDFKGALEITAEVRELTGEVLQSYSRRGYDAAKIGRNLEKALGDRQFVGGRISPEDPPQEVLNTVFAEIRDAWKQLGETVKSQAAERFEKTTLQPPETIPQKIEGEIRVVWQKKAEDRIKLGSEVEELRSGVGLRTLAALLARYNHRDAEGREDAMPAAYAWAGRAYWLTKHSIRQYELLGSFGKTAVQEQLRTLGGKFEDWLGHSDLGHYLQPSFGEAPKIDTEERGWPVIDTTEKTVRQTWQGMKKILKD